MTASYSSLRGIERATVGRLCHAMPSLASREHCPGLIRPRVRRQGEGANRSGLKLLYHAPKRSQYFQDCLARMFVPVPAMSRSGWPREGSTGRLSG